MNVPHIMLLTELDHCYIKVTGLTTKTRHLDIQVYRGINIPLLGEHGKNSYTEITAHLSKHFECNCTLKQHLWLVVEETKFIHSRYLALLWCHISYRQFFVMWFANFLLKGSKKKKEEWRVKVDFTVFPAKNSMDPFNS